MVSLQPPHPPGINLNGCILPATRYLLKQVHVAGFLIKQAAKMYRQGMEEDWTI